MSLFILIEYNRFNSIIEFDEGQVLFLYMVLIDLPTYQIWSSKQQNQYSKNYTMSTVQTAVLLSIKPSSEDDTKITDGLGGEASLPLIQRAHQYHMILPGFICLSSPCWNAISMLMQQGSNTGSFSYISFRQNVKVQA